MNGTLEAMAQATYRDWFVDFGPVRRKLAGIIDPVEIMGGLTRDPSEAASMAALFPHALDNERLPEGWRLIKIEQILDLIYGKSLPKTVRNNGNVPVYGSGGVGGFHNKSLVKGPGIIVGRKGTVGSLFWETEDFFPIDTAFYVAPKNNLPLHFVWQVLQTLGLEGMNTDAAVPGLNRNNVYRLETVWPGEKIVKTFGELITPIRARLDVNTAQNRTLAETRDYLLPA